MFDSTKLCISELKTTPKMAWQELLVNSFYLKTIRFDILLNQLVWLNTFLFLLMLIPLFSLPVFQVWFFLVLDCYSPVIESILRMLHTSRPWWMWVDVTSIPKNNCGSLMDIDVVCASKSLVYVYHGTDKIEMKHHIKCFTQNTKPQVTKSLSSVKLPMSSFSL